MWVALGDMLLGGDMPEGDFDACAVLEGGACIPGVTRRLPHRVTHRIASPLKERELDEIRKCTHVDAQFLIQLKI